MDGRDGRSITRRTALKAAGALALGGAALSAGGAASEQTDDAEGSDRYVLEQGDECVPVTPLTGSDPVSAFYDWESDPSLLSSAGTVDLQRPDTSLLFLYRGPDGATSLVVVHGKFDPSGRESGGDGGAVTFEIRGLPSSGEWNVRDDDRTSHDRWRVDSEPQRIDWTWRFARTDGGAYGPLGDDFDVRIDPAFNEAAELFGDYNDGRIRSWELLSGDRSDPDRVSLAMDEPVRLRTGTCGEEVPADMDVHVSQGRVNPRSNGVLKVDIRSTDKVSVGDLQPETVQTAPDGVRPERTRLDQEADRLRAFFRTRQLDLDDFPTTTLTIEAETDAGRRAVGEATVRLTPDRRSKGEGDERDEEDEHESEREEEDEGEEEREDEDEYEREDEDEDEREDEDEGETERDDDDDDDDERDDEGEPEEDDDERGDTRGRGNGHESGRGKEKGERGRGEDGGKRGRGNGKGDN